MTLSALSPGVGVSYGGGLISYLAFADDVALCASSRLGLQANLDRFLSAARALGLQAGVTKCATLGIRALGKEKTWVQDSESFHAEGRPIRVLRPTCFYKYLGLALGGDTLISMHKIHEDLCIKLERLQKAPAKPQQKLWALTKVLLPQMQYPLVHADSPLGQLQRCDRAIRTFVRKALHLPRDTPSGYFHANTVDGGLGIPNMETRIPRLREDLLSRLRESEDAAVRCAVDAGGWPIAETNQRQRRLHERQRWQDKLHQSVDGKGLKGMEFSPLSSQWIQDGSHLMSGRDFVTSIKIRGNLMPTKIRSARGREIGEAQLYCDLCRRQVETLGHLMQRCHMLQGARICRHDRVVDFAVAKLRDRGYTVLKEPPIRTSEGVRYPDIVAWHPHGNFSYIIDAQVVADSAAGPIDHAHEQKVAHYNKREILDHVRALSGFAPVVSTLTLDWRGRLAPVTAFLWTQLGLNKQDLKVLVARVLEGGCRLWREFKRTPGGPAPHPG